MATASNLQVKSPRANTYASSCVPDAEAIDLVVLALDDLGMIRDCGRACEQMFGYPPHELAGRHVSLLLPQLPDIGLVQEGRINSRLAHLCHCAVSFQALRQRAVHQSPRQPQRGCPCAQPRSLDVERRGFFLPACPLAAVRLHLQHDSPRSGSHGHTIRRLAATGSLPGKQGRFSRGCL